MSIFVSFHWFLLSLLLILFRVWWITKYWSYVGFAKSWFVVTGVVVNVFCFTSVTWLVLKMARTTASGTNTGLKQLMIATIMAQTATDVEHGAPVFNVLAKNCWFFKLHVTKQCCVREWKHSALAKHAITRSVCHFGTCTSWYLSKLVHIHTVL